jgi:hypothetical protein
MLRALGLTVLLLSLAGAAQAAEPIGRISRLQGTAQLRSEGVWSLLRPLAAVHQGDIVATAAGARAEVALDDGTVLTLGENAQLQLDEFVFRPAGRNNRMEIAAIGAFRFVAGTLDGSPAKRARIRTASATLGIRGTDFWGGPIDGRHGVLLLQGAVEVATAVGSVLLDRPGQGTNLDGAGLPPGPVTTWPRNKVERALASVAFR